MKHLLSRLYRLVPFRAARFLLWLLHPKFNLGAAGVFLAPDGRVLILRHVYRHRYPWGLPGGYLGRDEPAEAGLLRELREETGLAGRLDGVLGIERANRFQTEIVFLGRIDPAQPISLSHEIFDAAFVAPDALPADMLPRHAALVAKAVSSPR